MSTDFPTTTEQTPRRDVRIEKVNNGWIVKIGCTTFVFQAWSEVSEGLELFYKNPQKAQEKYYKV